MGHAVLANIASLIVVLMGALWSRLKTGTAWSQELHLRIDCAWSDGLISPGNAFQHCAVWRPEQGSYLGSQGVDEAGQQHEGILLGPDLAQAPALPHGDGRVRRIVPQACMPTQNHCVTATLHPVPMAGYGLNTLRPARPLDILRSGRPPSGHAEHFHCAGHKPSIGQAVKLYSFASARRKPSEPRWLEQQGCTQVYISIENPSKRGEGSPLLRPPASRARRPVRECRAEMRAWGSPAESAPCLSFRNWCTAAVPAQRNLGIRVLESVSVEQSHVSFRPAVAASQNMLRTLLVMCRQGQKQFMNAARQAVKVS